MAQQQDSQTMLAMLKTDLGISAAQTAYDTRLEQLLTAAQKAIIGEGASTLDASDPLDMQLIVMYAAWLWRSRDNIIAMPPMLRWNLNNRVLSEHAREAVDADA